MRLKHFFEEMYWLASVILVSSLTMTREQATRKRDKLAARLCSPTGILRGSLLQRPTRPTSGRLICARAEGHPLWVLTVNDPCGTTSQISLRPAQIPQDP